MLSLTITTVEREVLSVQDIRQVSVPTVDGEITILPGHISLVSVLGMGEVRIIPAQGKEMELFVDGGIVQVSEDHIELLTNLAERAHEIDEAKIEEAKRRAVKLLEEKPIDIDLAKVEASLQRELTKLKLTKKWKKHKKV